MTISSTIRILHLSDLHERGSRESEPWRRRRVLGSAWEQNIDTLLDEGPIDLVCFTGDAADWGKAEELASTIPFFEALLDRLGLGVERLFAVPGNHDVDRSIAPDAWEQLRQAAARADALDFARWMAGGTAPPGFDDSWRDAVLRRQGAYRTWLHHDLGRAALDPAAGPHGVLGYRQELTIRGVALTLVGLDTAWLCGDDHDAGRLWLTDQQVLSLLDGDSTAPCLVLMHHPFAELADGAHCRRLVSERADLVLRGHLHETELHTVADPDRQLLELAAGCLYEGHRADRWPNACQLLTLHLDTAGQLRRIEARLRSFSPRGHWFDDDGLYRESRQGRLSLSVTPRTRSDNGDANPFDPWTPAVPPAFQGRREVLRRLDEALGEAHSVSIVGDGRIGKSSLLATWSLQLVGSGRTIRQLSGEGPEGSSAEAFARALTGRACGEGTEQAAEAVASWLAGQPEGLPPVVLVDECDIVVRNVDPRFFERMRGLLGRIVLVLASRHEIDQLYEDRGLSSPFHNRLRLERLALLEEDAVDALIQLGERWLTPDDRALLHQWAGRHPFYLQLLGRCLVDARRRGDSSQSALARFRDEAASRLRNLWTNLQPRERDAVQRSVQGETVESFPLERRGVLDGGRPFGEVLAKWVREER